MAELVIHVEGSDLPIRTLPLDAGVTIGRSDTCTVFNDDRHLSRDHCRIEPIAEADNAGEGGWRIVDNQSTNGTRVGDQRIAEPQILNDGDVIRVGPLHIVFHANTMETPPIAWPPRKSEMGKSDLKASGDTILDGIIANAVPFSSRAHATARKAPPRLNGHGLPTVRRAKRRSQSASLSIADLAIRTANSPNPAMKGAAKSLDRSSSENALTTAAVGPATESPQKAHWWNWITGWLARRRVV